MLRKSTLTSIPEMDAEEEMDRRWVPKKKHEVLKAKYKCLKKLFQIYDASVIGILPDPNPESADETKPNRRRKRSHRTKTDACAGTTEITDGDNTYSECDNTSVATAIIRELQIDQSCISTQLDTKIDKYAETISNDMSEKNLSIEHDTEQLKLIPQCPHMAPYPQIPYYMGERRKLTRFQCFVQRLFGIRRDSYILPNEQHMHALSDPIISFREKRRRRGMRFRRIRRPKKIRSDGALRDLKSPGILSFVQSVQRSCLMDTTPRQCPIVGCKKISYGIINYNDHLNICHFKDRKFICHYCHEGFERECDKIVHENEHIGITKLSTDLSNLSTGRQSSKVASNTQTEPENKIQEEKLKKIVSFFDKISDPNQILSEIKKNRSSEMNLASKMETASSSGSEKSDKTRTISCCNISRKCERSNVTSSSAETEVSSRRSDLPLACHYCGENFRYRRQLSLHVDLEHRMRDKYSKCRSCAGIISPHVGMISEDGSINVHSVDQCISDTDSLKRVNTPSTMTENTVSRRKSDENLSCDPSTNIIYYTSMESLRKPSLVDSFVKKVRSYRWEPGTKIIRV